MDARLDCEVDVEGAVDMMDREEERLGTAAISRRPCLRPNTADSPGPGRLGASRECLGLWALPCCLYCTRSSSNHFCDFKSVQKPQPERRSDISRHNQGIIIRPHVLARPQ
jgi:hypothetical protein